MIPRACERESEAIPSGAATGFLDPLNPPRRGMKRGYLIVTKSLFLSTLRDAVLRKLNTFYRGAKFIGVFCVPLRGGQQGVEKMKQLFKNFIGLMCEVTK